MTSTNKIETTYLLIKGLIQGVGFRPFIYRIAKLNNLKGIVYNQNNGVIILIQGKRKNIKEFIKQINLHAPIAANIESVEQKLVYKELFTSFEILSSKTSGNSITQVSPDIAVCDNCLSDIENQAHRIDYSFTNCTNCGPRYSIIENIPYDRKSTSMKHFKMCPECKKEYSNISDRRFHAQPIACNNCGPKYILHSKEEIFHLIENILNKLSIIIKSGGVVAIKGLGGYHLACDAYNSNAVEKLRQIKKRDGKPFAVMFSSIEAAKANAIINTDEEKALCSWQRPIVLVQTRNKFPSCIAGRLNTIGVFLPYLAFHYQLFNNIKTKALVMTSCNISNCPIITDNNIAIKNFANKADAVLIHNRDIINRQDDSVVHLVGSKIQNIRRSRGFAPAPMHLQLNTEGIFATGAELSNAFCIGKSHQAILSQHIGDLKNLETMELFEQTFSTMKRLFEFEPKHIACDMHPEYLSTKFADNMNLHVIKTQHHHAHIAACMAEYGIDEQVIGLSFDGTGYGTDGKIWGSEILLADLSHFDRKYHFEYVSFSGGDNVSKDPWRSALSYLSNAFNGNIPKNLPFLNNIASQQQQLILLAIKNNINTYESCSVGRLFDAVSALLNICTHASYHAEAPILLEHHIKKNIKEYYPITLESKISWKNVIKEIVNDLKNNISTSVISAKFHNTLIRISFEAIKNIHRETGINKVVLSGGCFQNKYISENLLDLLHETGLKPFISVQVPVNDGGIALGQLAIAAKTLALCV